MCIRDSSSSWAYNGEAITTPNITKTNNIFFNIPDFLTALLKQ
jgi:hypothetical protein